jgi:nucleoside-diphosphate-sugar epimerase
MDVPRADGSGRRRVFVAGASGAIGRALVPKLVDAGHEVTAMTRTPEKADDLGALGAEPVVCDVFAREQLTRVVADARPDVVVNQLTDLPKGGLEPKKVGEYYARNNRVRREGTDNLLAAARAVGAGRYIGQSVAFWYDPVGPDVKSEDDPLWRDAPPPIGEAIDALKQSEDAVVDADDVDGIVLRYGTFYGPGTWYSPDGEIARQMRKRRYPLIGDGRGYTSFIHVDDAAAACVAAVERGERGVYNAVDDEPAKAREWMPVFATAVGAKPPRRVPVRLARLLAGKAIVEWSTRCPGASNEKIKRELGWSPRHATWRRGFDAIR